MCLLMPSARLSPALASHGLHICTGAVCGQSDGDSQQKTAGKWAVYALQHASSRLMTDAAGLHSSQAPRWSKQKATPCQWDGHSLANAQRTSKHGQAAWCACRTAPGLNSVAKPKSIRRTASQGLAGVDLSIMLLGVISKWHMWLSRCM